MTSFNLDSIPRIPLCILPTPLIPLKRLTTYLAGANIFIKRDDLSGMAYGGNKNRKLEFLLADAKEKKADVIITEGDLNSNHCLQTAACAAKLGFECELVLSGEDPNIVTGNLLLDQILDVKVHRVEDRAKRKGLMKEVEKELIFHDKRPYSIPTGGSTKIGALGYLNCISEIVMQLKYLNIDLDYFIHATASGGTQAGVLIGKEFYYQGLEVLGINVGEPQGELEKIVQGIITEFMKEWDLDLKIKDDMIQVLEGYYGEGYGIPNQETFDAVKLIAKLEGIFLDPVYSGKAMVGLIDLVKTRVIPKGKNVIFLHSGGGPSLFSYYAGVDMTERKEIELLRSREQVLLELNERQKKFMTTVSHELRTPITALSMSIKNLQRYRDKLSVENRTNLIEAINENSKLLTKIIEEVSLLSRIDEKTVNIQWKSYKLAKLFRNLETKVDPMLKEKKMRLETEIPEKIQLWGDSKIIEQVFTILIDNALRYSLPKTKVQIRVINHYFGPLNPLEETGVLIQVIDQGFGISHQDQQFVFDRFYRSKAVENIPGTGVGLTIAREFIHLHHGEIHLESEFGKGSTFSVFLPYHE